MTTSQDDYRQNLISNHSSKGGSWRQQVEACKHVICLIYKHRPTSKGAKIMCIEIMYSVKTLFVSSEILNAEALQKSEEIE